MASDITAPPGAWKLLGELLGARRRTLGYRYRTQLERERGLNKRMAADIEKAYADRINTFPAGTLRHIAEVYEVTYASVLAVLAGDADKLDPATTASAPPDPSSPFADPARTDLNRPWFDPLNERRVRLAARGITDPTGAQMFPDAPGDAKAWDGIAESIPVGDKVWILADLRRRAASRAAGAEAGAPGALTAG